MTNAPDNFESYILPDGVDKIAYERETKILNCGTFKLEREDHTIGNLLRMQLLRDPDVIFVGYSHPHPIKHHILLRVQTAVRPSRGGTYLPPNALQAALQDLQVEVGDLARQLKEQSRERE